MLLGITVTIGVLVKISGLITMIVSLLPVGFFSLVFSMLLFRWVDIKTMRYFFGVVMLIEFFSSVISISPALVFSGSKAVIISNDILNIRGTRTPILFMVDDLSMVFIFILFTALLLCFWFLSEYFEYDAYGWSIMLLSASFSQLAFVFFCTYDIISLLVFWEWISIVSFFLIKFWTFRVASLKASLKVFIISQIGDVFFITSIIVLAAVAHSTDFGSILSTYPLHLGSTVLVFGISISMSICVGLGVVFAVFLKGAQGLFFPWLLDAMEAPVPISAQLHSSTLVIIGFYVVYRLWPIIEYQQALLYTVGIVGCLTSVFASILGFFQDDGKRLLACSTAGQLGYVLIALSLGLYSESLLLLVFCCCNKAYTFVWFGLIMSKTNGLSDFRAFFYSRLCWTERLGLCTAVLNTTIAPGAFAWYVKSTLASTSFMGLSPVFILLLTSVLGLTWLLSSVYMFRLLAAVAVGSLSQINPHGSALRTYCVSFCKNQHGVSSQRTTAALFTLQLLVLILLTGVAGWSLYITSAVVY